MSLIKAVLFDLDGVIVDTSNHHFLAWKKLCLKFGHNLTETENEFIKGLSREESLIKIIDFANLSFSEEKFNQYLIKKNSYYLDLINTISPKNILPGVKIFLNYLKKKSIKTSLCSSSKNAKLVLKKLDLISFFDFIIDGNDIKMGKPNPEIFLTASKKLKMKPKNCLVFEDAQSGIDAANNAGMVVFGIGNKNNLKNLDYCFTDFLKITDNLKNKFF